MTLINWIFLGLIVIDTGLYILSLIKNFSLLRTITNCLLLPFTGTFLILFLLDYMPDSRHIMITSMAAISFVSLAVIFFNFNKKTAKILFKLFHLLGILAWIELYKSCFFIYRIPVLMYVLCTIAYLGVFVTFAILSGRQKFFYYFNHFISLCFSNLLNFCSFTLLCFHPCLQSILLFAGTTTLIALNLFYILNSGKHSFKHFNQISLLLIIISQALIAVSNILMIA